VPQRRLVSALLWPSVPRCDLRPRAVPANGSGGSPPLCGGRGAGPSAGDGSAAGSFPCKVAMPRLLTEGANPRAHRASPTKPR
jgi:hypothetical protein